MSEHEEPSHRIEPPPRLLDPKSLVRGDRAPRFSPSLVDLAKIILIVFVVVSIGLFFEFHLNRFLTISALHEHQEWLQTRFARHPLKTVVVYSVVAMLFIVFALPAATIIELLSGALFGPWLGTVICSLSISIGGVISLLSSRFLFRDAILRRFARQAAIVEREYEASGVNYLISMRLIPVLPYFVTNLIFGLTTIRPRKFWMISWLCSLPSIFLYASAGSELSKLNDLGDIFTPKLLAAFAALAALPFLGRFISKKFLHVRPPK